MAYYVRIDEKEDFEWLQRVLSNWLSKDPNEPLLQTNYKHIYNWDQYLNNRVTAKEVAAAVDNPVVLLTEQDTKKIAPRPKAPPRRGRPPKKKPVAKKKVVEPESLYDCVIHKTYHGKRRPQHDCEKCWSIYKLFNRMKYAQARKDFERSQAKSISEKG